MLTHPQFVPVPPKNIQNITLQEQSSDKYNGLRGELESLSLTILSLCCVLRHI